MIKKLSNQNTSIARQIHSVFQASYAVEAQLLNAVDFPPLKREIKSFINSRNTFFGYHKNNDISGVIEVHSSNKWTHIQSLVVHPKYFRQGIGKALTQFIFDTYPSKLFMVETGLENIPAITLYKNLGFVEVKQWDTDHGIRKIRLEKKLLNISI